ncbi:MAG: hypothetical protein Q8P67_21060 [archaeon]|nr:hypothetical protein [archaeon]
MLEVSLDPKPYTQLTELAIRNEPTDFALIRRQGLVFHSASAEAMKEDARSDMYITLVSGHFPSRAPGARPGCPIDVEVSMSIRLNSGWAVSDSICIGRGTSPAVSEYNSPIILRSQDPTWWETVRLANLPSSALHLYFQIRLIHPTEARFSLLHAYLRLVKDSTALQDGTYVLRVFSNSQNSRDPAFYLKEQSTADDKALDVLVVRLQLASLVHTQSDILTQLSHYRQYPPSQLQPILAKAIQSKSLVFRIETIKLYSRLLPLLLALTHSSKHVSLKNLSVQVLCAFTKNFAKLPHFRIILQHVLRTFKFTHLDDVTNVLNTLQVFASSQTRSDAPDTSSEDKFISFIIQMFEMDQTSPLLSLALKKLFVSSDLLQRATVSAKPPKTLNTKLLPAVLRQLDFFLQGLAYRNSEAGDLALIVDIIEWLIFHTLFQLIEAPSPALNQTMARLESFISRLPTGSRGRFVNLDLSPFTSAETITIKSILKPPGTSTGASANVSSSFKPPAKHVTFGVMEENTGAAKVSKTKYLRQLEKKVERAAESERLRLESEASETPIPDEEVTKWRIVVEIGPRWKLRVPFPCSTTVEDLILEIRSRILMNKPRLSSIGQTDESLDHFGLRGQKETQPWSPDAIIKDVHTESDTVIVVWPQPGTST